MCGIIGYVGGKSASQIVFSGLQKLEYRGYDSSGIAVIADQKLGFVKAEGKLSNLAPLIRDLSNQASIGMGHTRWATHGAPTTANAHPHVSGGTALIHNGIIENYQELKAELIKQEVKFLSETDTEVVLHLIAAELKTVDCPRKALIAVLKKLEGAFSLAVICEKDPEVIHLAKKGSPLVIGFGEGENFFASDALALVDQTKKVAFMNDGELASLSKDKAEFFDFSGNKIDKSPVELNWSATSSEKDGYRHYMLKEIHQQPSVMANSIQRYVDLKNKKFNDEVLGINQIDLSKIDRIHIIACGTAFYSGLVTKYAMEPVFKVPVEVELASEFRYREPILSPETLVIPVSQSGETADTLACVQYAKDKGCQVLAVCNVLHSSIPRTADSTLYMEAGPEIGVASTKAFTSMILSLYILSMAMDRKRENKNFSEYEQKIKLLQSLPALMDKAISGKGEIEEISSRYYEYKNCIFMGRGISYPISLEGSLKLKEISYIHAEGYAGGELKHGPIALIDKHMPVVALVPDDKYREKMISNVEEVKARDGRILGIGSSTDEKLKKICHDYINVPQIKDEVLQSILSVIPMQFFSYYVAVRRGTDVDQPRNLAKSVTVE